MTAVVEQVPGLVLTEHEIEVPLDHDATGGPTLTVFAREVRRPGDGDDRPVLVYLQGGPGGESPRPTGAPAAPGWLQRALEDYRVLLLDQRGTGRSTPYSLQPGVSDADQADYLTHFRADSIVRDCEVLREHLGIERWSLLGQSFGGFCALTYLSLFPDRLREVMITGGVAPVGLPIERIYAATFDRAMELSERYWRTFPRDRDRLRRAIELADAGEIVLPTGDALSGRQLRSLGHRLGMGGGDLQLHYLLERDPRSPRFAADAAAALPFGGDAPIYTLLHEACCADGGATRWACERVQPAAYTQDDTLLTAEHPFRWHLQEANGLRPYAGIADLLAEHEWPRLYDEAALRTADVPVVATVYYDDPFVLREPALRTAELLPRMRPWITNEYLHNGLRAGPVLDRLIDMVQGKV